MSERADRINNFRRKFAGSTRFTGGTLGGVAADGTSTRKYTFSDGNSNISMAIGSDGRIASVTQTAAKASEGEKTASGSSKKSGGGDKSGSDIRGAVGKVVIGLEYDTENHQLVAKIGTLKFSDGIISVEETGSEMVFEATPHSGEI